MARKTIFLILLGLLLLSSITTTFASESEVQQEANNDVEPIAEPQESASPLAEEDLHLPTDTPVVQEPAAYTVLKTWCGIGIAVYGEPIENAKPGIIPFIVGSRPCLFDGCPNSVTVTSKYSFVCNTHKCSVAGCPWVYYQTKPKLCQTHAGITNITCQVVDPEKFVGLCGKPSVGNGSPCCWEHHCPGCFGIGNGNATLCDLCMQCWG